LSSDRLLQINASTGAYVSFPASSTSSKSLLNSLGFDHDDDDDDDHHHDDDDDDDDDHHGGGDNNGGGIQLSSSLTFVAQGKTKNQAYFVYQPTLVGDTSVSNTCNTIGDNGIFLSEIGKNTTRKMLSSNIKIDSYGGGSGSDIRPPILIKPTQPTSAARCRNNHIKSVTPILKKKLAAAVFTNGSSYQAELQLLRSDSLTSINKKYLLSTTTPQLILNKQESELLVLQGTRPIILDTETLIPREYIGTSIQHATFVNSDSELLVSNNTSAISWLDIKNSGQTIKELALDSKIKYIASDPTGRYSAVLTQSKLYFIDNASRSITNEIPYTKSSIYSMSMLTDKIIISRAGTIDYIQFGNIVGSPIKVAYQFLSKDLLTQWMTSNGNSLHSTTLSHLLQAIGESDAISEDFTNIDIEWLPSGATTASEVTGARLSGYYRSERISITKALR